MAAFRRKRKDYSVRGESKTDRQTDKWRKHSSVSVMMPEACAVQQVSLAVSIINQWIMITGYT